MDAAALARVHAASAIERRLLADDLAGLTPQQWAAPSLCAEWSLRDVVAHLVAALDPRPGPLLRALVRSGGRLHAANSALARAVARSRRLTWWLRCAPAPTPAATHQSSAPVGL